MSNFMVLDADDSVQYSHWLDLWESRKIREVFTHPDYLKAQKRECDSALCAVWEDLEGIIMMPVILRPLAAEVWAGSHNQNKDIVSPYGFGGPFVKGTSDMLDFWKSLSKWAENNKVISGFFRFSPFVEDFGGYIDQLEIKGGNVIRSLSEGKEKVWQEYPKSLRQKLRQADKKGLQLEVDINGERLEEFLRVYYGIMDRKNAVSSYYFPEQFFQTILQKIPGHCIIFHALSENVVIASNMVLVSDDIIYGFLGGSDRKHLDVNSGMSPTEFMYHSIINWGIDNGKKYLVLGGGYEGCDGIFDFKKKFAPNGIFPFKVGKHIFDPVAYTEMSEKRRDYESGLGREWVSDTTYFPNYRAKED